MYDRKRLDEVRDWAKAEITKSWQERQLDITHWFSETPECGTRMCLGGYAVSRAGGEFIWSTDPESGSSAVYNCELNGRTWLVSDAARDLLGLTEDEAYVLFDLDVQFELEMVMQFLDELCDRAMAGKNNLSEEEVDRFVEMWSEPLYPMDYYM